jgi:hypothetical protein
MIGWRRLGAWLAASLAAATGTHASAADLPGIDLARERAAIEAFQTLDQHLQDIGWKFVRGNASFCSDVVPSVGLQLQDAASYGRSDIARAALGLTGDFAVQTAAAGSPAALTGAFARNREVSAVGALDPNGWEAGESMHWERLARLHDFIDQRLARAEPLAITFADGTRAQVAPVPVCASRFELMNDSDRALADGRRVVIGAGFPGFTYPEPLLAAAIAHELAHNLLRHTAWLDREGRKRRHVRLTEREADRLMPWLMANAGYDPSEAQRFMRRWGKAHDGGVFRKRTHDGWDERAKLIAAEGRADWSRHFRREIDPAGSREVARRN